MPSRKPHVITADPPWPYKDKLPGKTRGAIKNYKKGMSIEEIKAFKLPPHADDCILFLWRVHPMQEEALEVMKAWGFKQKSEVVWLKLTPKGKRHFGMGRYVRAAHEVCLIGVKGKAIQLIKNKGIRSVFETVAFEAKTGEHSEKPQEFYDLVEDLVQGPYVELFARVQRKGWEQQGNELKTFAKHKAKKRSTKQTRRAA